MNKVKAKKTIKPKKDKISKKKNLSKKSVVKRKTKDQNSFFSEPLAVGHNKKEFFLLFKKVFSSEQELFITFGKQDTKFDGKEYPVQILDTKNKKENISICSDFRFSVDGKKTVMTYVKGTESGKILIYAESSDKKKWKIKNSISKVKTASVVNFVGKKMEPHIFFGDHVLKIARQNKKSWDIVEPPKAPHWHFFDGVPFSIIGGIYEEDHFVVFYSAIHKVDIMKDVNLRDEKIGEERLLKIGAAIFAKDVPTRLLWQTELPIMEIPIDRYGTVNVLGLVPVSNKKDSLFRIYTSSPNGEMGFVDLPGDIVHDHKNRKQVLLKRYHNNPILTPTHFDWERDGAFNPTALHLDGKTHLIYRAVGADGSSSIGYASTTDGLNIDERLKKPIYTPRFWFEKSSGEETEKSDIVVGSGGSWGGCEDPKITQIEDRIYMTYVAHDGSWPTRTVLTSISVEDFLNKKWRWSKPQVMSPPGVGSKSVVLMPEKINDSYYVFHRMWPNIMLDVVPDLEFGEDKKWLKGDHMIRPRKSFWDSRKMSVGATPIKTKDGWLVIYNAVDRLDSSKYKIGAMLLDLRHPEKVIARSRRPLLSPEEFYENDGKPGVAYPGGAVDRDGILNVYYGGGDKVCCVAQIPTDELVWNLKKDSEHHFKINKLR